MKSLRIGVLAVAALSLAPVLRADNGDSSADVRGGFANAMLKTKGVIVTVPVNAAGEENTDLAQMRVYEGNAPVKTAEDVSTAWTNARDIKTLPGASEAVDLDKDSSTFFHRHWVGCGWRAPLYYATYYQPVFTYQTVAYTYVQPVYYAYYQPVVYAGYSYWGYRTYFYASAW